ncbi:MAG: cadmium-translocating P-type ATPase [Planctomycetes bacterium]|nr:cadmium-translocating P-type ATPase [Planctomycetota bacterium]
MSATTPFVQQNESAAQEADQKAVAAWLFATLVGGALILNSYLWDLFFETAKQEDAGIVSSLTALVGAILLASPLLYRSAQELIRGKLHMGELASLAVLACMATGKYQEAGLVAFFLMLADLLENRSALGAQAAVEQLIRLTPNEAHLIDKQGERDVQVSALSIGDRIRVRPGENVPADGVIKTGESTINQASVTGESLPVDKLVGDHVFAGTINLTGMIEVEVTNVGTDTTIGKVRDLILDAEKTKLPIMRLIDTHVQWYTPTIIMIAAIILYFTKNVDNAITALVVACPCAFVLATPTAMVAGLSCAARLGILIKNVSHLESAGNINAIVFDKTGTLTTGELAVTKLTPAAGVDAADLLYTAATADRHSNHPAARALVKVARDAKVKMGEPTEFTEHGGRGASAKIEGSPVMVGRRTWLEEKGVSTEGLEDPAKSESEGYSTLYVALGGKCLGWIGMVDRARPEARNATSELHDLGVRNLTMLTGDRWGVARRIGGELGCTDVVAECLPEQKLELVEDMKKRGLRVAVVGDGVNDAPALAAGDLGVAMGAAGNDVAIHSASIALMSDDLRRLPFLVRLSRKVRGVVLQNLLFGVFLVVSGLIASGMGWLSPVIAAILHNVGSFIVIFNSARVVRFGEEIAPHQG